MGRNHEEGTLPRAFFRMGTMDNEEGFRVSEGWESENSPSLLSIPVIGKLKYTIRNPKAL